MSWREEMTMLAMAAAVLLSGAALGAGLALIHNAANPRIIYVAANQHPVAP